MEKKSICSEIKAVSDETRSVTGYANVKNVVDLGGDLVIDGAYKNLGALVTNGWATVSHDWNGVAVGMIVDAKEDAYGLQFTVQLHDTVAGNEVYQVCKERFAAGKGVHFSIGYFTKDSVYETRDGEDIRVLKSIEVVEVSFVTMPMNPASVATGVKSGLRLQEQFDNLRAGLSDFKKRLAFLSADRKNGLSDEKLVMLAQIQSDAEDLVAELKSIGKTPVETHDWSASDLRVLENAMTELLGGSNDGTSRRYS